MNWSYSPGLATEGRDKGLYRQGMHIFVQWRVEKEVCVECVVMRGDGRVKACTPVPTKGGEGQTQGEH